MKALIATKLGMTQLLADDGWAIGITLLQAGPCVVTQVKTQDKDGYDAVQIGFKDKPKQGKSRQGHLKASKQSPSVLKEFRLDKESELSVGESLSVDGFSLGDKVKATATSKGKGFAGTVKRHNFSRGPVSHGSQNVRQPGSIGSMFPQKVFKGKKMAGRMGGERTATKNLEIALIDKERNLIGLIGSVPGANRATVIIEAAK